MRRPVGTLFGRSPVAVGHATPAPRGRFAEVFGERFYVIDDAQAMRPFLMSLVSDGDHWLFVTSTGALTAGRRHAGIALFPYVTEDKLADGVGTTGPVTAMTVTRKGRRSLWHPLRGDDALAYRVTRRLYKNILGSRVVFEETNHDLGVTFRYAWSTSDAFGFVRECTLVNDGTTAVELHVLDGLVNVLPANVDEKMQASFSCLLDAYKTSELLRRSRLALYALAAQPVDRAEPCESLKATTVWSHGLAGAAVHLSAERLATFDAAEDVAAPPLVRGRRGAYLLEGTLQLAPQAQKSWLVVADVDQSQGQVTELRAALRTPGTLAAKVHADVARGREELLRILAATDGLQHTADEVATAHHAANVLFNDLRGGVYAYGYDVPGRDFAAFVRSSNHATWARHERLLGGLGERIAAGALMARAEATCDPDLVRHAFEYLPLTFSRRHGDPSRPWNRFNIQVKDEHGGRRLHFEGNWRDIFQNWEALSLSYPELLENVIAKFVNASTLDGHNPYRLGKDGIDWEVPDPDHPWSTLGYWGDHQIIYLLKLLELSLAHHPSRLRGLMGRALFSYANVPYELAPFADIVKNPRSTIRFDARKNARIRALCKDIGADGKLVMSRRRVLHVTLLEKLLVPALAKLANFVPGGGIWLNTQRPEWNDANNALVGYGVSMVTLAYLDRYLAFLSRLLGPLRGTKVAVSNEVLAWMNASLRAFEKHGAILDAKKIDDDARGGLLCLLGEAASAYRAKVYVEEFSGTTLVAVDLVLAFTERADAFLRHTIGLARRKDGLFHAYDILVPRASRRGRSFGLEHLYEMLEGQVAVASAPALAAEDVADVLDALAKSRMYRADQRSYMLYPDRVLPGFLEKNVIPKKELRASRLLARLVASGDTHVVVRDAEGHLRFRAELVNAEHCRDALARLRPAPREGDIEEVLAVYERVFRHRAFTGRSGTMFAYEGLGSIYWHMVGKLLVATQERFLAAAQAGDRHLAARLAAHYRAIRAGLAGLDKSPAEYGAFPLDPYSHTPAHAGAQQPGMTGQVKEEILTRMGELGVRVTDGCLELRPRLLARREFLRTNSAFALFDVQGKPFTLALGRGTLAFTYCQVPIVYHLGGPRRIVVTDARGESRTVAGDRLDPETSASVFARRGEVRRIDAHGVHPRI